MPSLHFNQNSVFIQPGKGIIESVSFDIPGSQALPLGVDFTYNGDASKLYVAYNNGHKTETFNVDDGGKQDFPQGAKIRLTGMLIRAPSLSIFTLYRSFGGARSNQEGLRYG